MRVQVCPQFVDILEWLVEGATHTIRPSADMLREKLGKLVDCVHVVAKPEMTSTTNAIVRMISRCFDFIKRKWIRKTRLLVMERLHGACHSVACEKSPDFECVSIREQRNGM